MTFYFTVLLFLTLFYKGTSLSNADLYWYNDGTGLDVNGATVSKITGFATNAAVAITDKLFAVQANGNPWHLFKYDNSEIRYVKYIGGFMWIDVCDHFVVLGGNSGGFNLQKVNEAGDDLVDLGWTPKTVVTDEGETWNSNDRYGGGFRQNDCSKIILGKQLPVGIRVFDFDTTTETVTYVGPVDCPVDDCPALRWDGVYIQDVASNGNDVVASSINVKTEGGSSANSGGIIIFRPNPSTGIYEVHQAIENPHDQAYDYFGRVMETSTNAFWVSSTYGAGDNKHIYAYKLNPSTDLYEAELQFSMSFSQLDFAVDFYNSLRFCVGTTSPTNQPTGSGQVQVWENSGSGWTTAYNFNTDHATDKFPNALICQFDYLIATSSYKGAGTGNDAGYIALHYLGDSPTLPPPPPACVTSPDCGNINQYCTATLECASTPCLVDGVVDHSLCDGIFQSGRLPICHKSGFCRDTVESTCSSVNKCALARKKYLDNSNSVGKVDVKFGANLEPSKQRQAALQQITQAKENSATTAELKAYVSASKEITLDGAYFDAVGNQQSALDAIKQTVCGVENVEFCTIQITGGTGVSRRVLNTEYTVTITYEVDDATFAAIENNTAIDDPAFLQDLADAAGVDAANVTVTATGGELTVTYVLVAESSDEAPLGTDVLQDIDDLEANLDNVTSTIASTLNFNVNDIQSTTLDKCDGRDCNGFGADLCDSNTGQCSCPNGYFGINCDETCTCANGGSCPVNTCICVYPYYGPKCNSTATHCSDGLCL